MFLLCSWKLLQSSGPWRAWCGRPQRSCTVSIPEWSDSSVCTCASVLTMCITSGPSWPMMTSGSCLWHHVRHLPLHRLPSPDTMSEWQTNTLALRICSSWCWSGKFKMYLGFPECHGTIMRMKTQQQGGGRRKGEDNHIFAGQSFHFSIWRRIKFTIEQFSFSYYAKLRQQEMERERELAEKYRDRARERRDGVNKDYEETELISTTANYRAVGPTAEA